MYIVQLTLVHQGKQMCVQIFIQQDKQGTHQKERKSYLITEERQEVLQGGNHFRLRNW